jgi:thiol-disulfide isomerase/thioredoxin
MGKTDDAKAAWDETLGAMSVQADGINACFQGWSTYAGWLTEIGDIEGAKKAYEAGKEKCSHPQVNTMFGMQLKNLEMIGQEPEAFPESAKDLDGKAVALSDFKDKVLLIDFWATWCGPCVAEMPSVVAAYEKFHAQGFEVLGVTLDHPGEADKVKEFASSNGMPWRQVYYPDGNNEVAQAYGVNSIPHTILVGKDGKVVRVGLRGDALGKAVERLLGASKGT